MTNKTPEELAEESAHILCKELGDYRAFEFLRDNYLAGYEAGRPKWVSVKERLPRKELTVLTYSTDKALRFGNIALHGRWEVERDGMEWTEEVTHWQPLPTLPTKED